jgi:N utilization substance protein A
MSIEVIHIIDQISREKGIERSILIDAMKSAMEAAARKNLPHLENLVSQFNENTGEVEIFTEKHVVDEVEDENLEIALIDSLKLNPDAEIGDTILEPQKVDNLGRIAAQLAKQVILQKVREAEIDIIYNDYKNRKGELINGFVHRFEHGDMIIDLGKAEGILPRREQVFRETFNRGDRVRAYILDIRKTPKKATVILSRTHVGLVENLFQLEVPEISEGMVEIMGIVREPSGRTKIAVMTNDRDIDAVGACVGMRGMRVQAIVLELRGEKIDIIEYSEDPEVFIRNALSPAKISRIISNPNEKHMTIIVADDQMSLAIGKKGQNVRLAAKLVKWRIDIKGESDIRGESKTPDIFATDKTSSSEDENFLEVIKNTKGLGEKIVALLFSENIVSFQEVIKRGTDGLREVSGIGPKKAEAIFNFASSWLEDKKAKAPVEVAPGEEAEKPSSVTAEKIEAEEQGDPEAEEVDEDQDFPLGDLVSIDSGIIELLEKSGFQTIAELSVAPIDELAAIDGIEEEEAKSIFEKAKQYMENLEKV